MRKYYKSDIPFHTLNYIGLSIILFVVGYPLFFVLSSSFSSGEALLKGQVWFLPVGPTLEGYKLVFEAPLIWVGYRNSLIYTSLTTFLALFVTLFAAYPLACPHFRGKKLVMTYFVITMFFSGGLVPTYLLIKALGLYNNPLVMIVPGLVSVWNIIITRTFFQSSDVLPLREAATIDGANDFTYFFQILLPLSGAIIAVNCLFVAVGSWNSYFSAMIYLTDSDLWPIQLILRKILILNQPEININSASEAQAILDFQRRAELMKYALIIIANLPVLIAYPFVQKHFIKGVMIGSIKG